jgi:hypothetical protein
VPQDAAFDVAPGVDAIVRVPEMPNREFPGKVTRTASTAKRYAHALDRDRHSQSRRRAAARGVPNFSISVSAIAFASIVVDLHTRKTFQLHWLPVNHRAPSPRSRHYRWITRRPRLSDVHI